MDIAFEINRLVNKNLVLQFLYQPNPNTFKKILKVFSILWLLPFVILFVSKGYNTLQFEGENLGFLEDFLFLTFSFITVPTLVFVLYVVMKRFLVLLNSLENFVSYSKDVDYKVIKTEKINMVVKGSVWIKSLVYLTALFSLYLHLWGTFSRIGSWNSESYLILYLFSALYIILSVGIIVPQLLIMFVTIVVTQIRLMKELVAQDVIIIRPVSPDKCGGLKSLGELALSFTYLPIPFIVHLLIQYFSWGYLSFGQIIGIVAIIPFSIVLFFYPLSVVHVAMDAAKKETLEELSRYFFKEYKYLNQSFESLDKDDETSNRKSFGITMEANSLELLDMMYKKAEQMPVWPFDIRILRRFVATIFGPILIILLENIAQLVYHFLVK